MKYEIVQGQMFEQAAFERRVGRMLDDGWKPIGGVAVVRNGEGSAAFCFYQAMVREK